MESTKFFLWLAVCISAHMLRTTYEILKHRTIIRSNKLTFVVVFCTMIALWVSWFFACETDIAQLAVPVGIRAAGLLLCLAGVVIFFIALFTIKALETYEGDLMTRGIYSYLRHPMYLSFIFWLVGVPLFMGGGLTLMISILLIVNVLFWRSLEEKELVKRFPDYIGYKARTYF